MLLSYYLIVAQYDADGRLIGIKTAADSEITIEKNENTVYAKAFIWSGVDSLEPIGEAVSVYLSENAG